MRREGDIKDVDPKKPIDGVLNVAITDKQTPGDMRRNKDATGTATSNRSSTDGTFLNDGNDGAAVNNRSSTHSARSHAPLQRPHQEALPGEGNDGATAINRSRHRQQSHRRHQQEQQNSPHQQEQHQWRP